MYRSLNETLKKLSIKKGDLAKILGYSSGSKTLSIRINGSTRFTDEETEVIYSYLVSKGYSGSKEELFRYSEIEKKEKSYSRLSQIIKDGMKKQKLKNQDLADLVGVTVDTIDAWRNGRVTEIRSQYIDSVSEALDISPLYLLGDESRKRDGYISFDYSASVYNKESIISRVYNAILDYQINARGYKNTDVLIPDSTREILESSIQDLLNFFNDIVDHYNGHLGKKHEIGVLKQEIAYYEKKEEEHKKEEHNRKEKFIKAQLSLHPQLSKESLERIYDSYDSLTNSLIEEIMKHDDLAFEEQAKMVSDARSEILKRVKEELAKGENYEKEEQE